MKWHIFFSYYEEDQTFTNRRLTGIRRGLAQYGFQVFIARHNVPATDNFMTELTTAIRDAHAFIAFMSDRYFTSPWTQQELGYALGCGKTVIVVTDEHEAVAPEAFVSTHQSLLMTPDTTRAAEQLIDHLLERPGDHLWLGDAMVARISEVYDDRIAESLMGKLARVEFVSPRSRTALEAIATENTLLATRYGSEVSGLLRLPRTT
jgi:hypothetical protein